jgi:DNA-binding response OmpR family regulator
MRPSRTILLVGENEDTLSPLRYVLSNSQPEPLDKKGRVYTVTSANIAKDALGWLRKNQYDLMLCQCPVASLDSLLSHAKAIDDRMPTVVLYDKGSEAAECCADAAMHKPAMDELLERIRIMVQRRRGPHKGWKKGVAPERPVVQEMEVMA